MHCHWDRITTKPHHLPRKTAITKNTEGERGREREKQTGRDGKRGGGKADGERNRSRGTKKEVQRDRIGKPV